MLTKQKKILNFYQHIDEKYLLNIQKENLKLLKKKYNWAKFRKKIRKLILKKK